MADDSGQPGRLTTPEVLALARYSIGTLRRRIAEGRMPGPVDRCGSGGVYDKQAVMAALGLGSTPDGDSSRPAVDRSMTAEEFARKRAELTAESRRRTIAARLLHSQDSPHPPPVSPDPAEAIEASLQEHRQAAWDAKKAKRQTEARIRLMQPHAPTKPPELGYYVVMRPRSDGRFAVYFHVSAKHRPKGWRPTIPLPLDPPRTGNMADRKEVARIRKDAYALYCSMTRERLAQARQARDVGGKD